MHNDIEQILFTQEQISARVKELGKQLSEEYKDKHPVFICILKGSSLFFTDLVREINGNVVAAAAPRAYVEKASDIFERLIAVLGLLYERKEESIDDEIEALINERQAARKEKNFKRADEIRDMLKEQGIILEDTPQGVRWHKA